jgi:transposase-like protein
MTTIKHKHTAQFKTQVVLELLKEEKTLSQVCGQFAIHPTQARRWKQKALEGLAVIFSDSIKNDLISKDELIQRLYTQIGQQKVELDWLKKKMGLSA